MSVTRCTVTKGGGVMYAPSKFEGAYIVLFNGWCPEYSIRLLVYEVKPEPTFWLLSMS